MTRNTNLRINALSNCVYWLSYHLFPRLLEVRYNAPSSVCIFSIYSDLVLIKTTHMVVWIEKRCCKHIVPLYIAESHFCGVHILGLIFTSILVVGGINCQTVGFLCCVMTSLIRDGLLFLISTFYLSDDGELCNETVFPFNWFSTQWKLWESCTRHEICRVFWQSRFFHQCTL